MTNPLFKKMFSYFLPTALMALPGLGVTHLLAWQGRNQVRDQIMRLDDMKRRYDRTTEDDMRIGGPSKFLEERKKEDDAWYEREISIQKAWLARPFWRQVWMPPFPDYANTK
jgi:hypothetical protein